MVTRTAAGTVRLHFEADVIGYAPVFGAPAITRMAGGAIAIEQPLTDMAGATSSICHAEDLDLGALPPGPWSVEWKYVAANGMTTSFDRAFVWSGTEELCSSTTVFHTSPAVPVSTGPVTIFATRAIDVWADPVSVVAAVVRSAINVDDEISSEGPGAILTQPQLHCFTTSVTLPPLAVGDYAVQWAVRDQSRPVSVDSFDLRVVQGRRRSARR